MTAVNIIRDTDSVHLITDGAGFRGNRVVAYGVKVFPIPHLSTAIAVRGTATMAHRLWIDVSSAFATYGEMKAGIVELLHGKYVRRARWARSEFGFEIAVAGWSDAGPDAFALASGGDAPWTIQPVPRMMIAPAYSGHAEIGIRIDRDGWDIDRVATHVIDRQRNEPVKGFGGRILRGAGCFAQVTTITHAGIATRIVKRYPDKIGEPVRL